MVKEERRKSERIKDEGLSLKLNAGDFDLISHTLDISESGIYCKVDRELPLMSKVGLVLMVPDLSKDEKAVSKLEVEGVVVREHPVIIDGDKKHYDVAIFFDNLSPKNKEIISNYISGKKA